MDTQEAGKLVIDVELQRKEFDLLKKEVEELNSALERARNIINDLAQKSVDIEIKLGINQKENDAPPQEQRCAGKIDIPVMVSNEMIEMLSF